MIGDSSRKSLQPDEECFESRGKHHFEDVTRVTLCVLSLQMGKDEKEEESRDEPQLPRTRTTLHHFLRGQMLVGVRATIDLSNLWPRQPLEAQGST